MSGVVCVVGCVGGGRGGEGGKSRKTGGGREGVGGDLRTSLDMLGNTNETVLIHEYKREYIQIQRYIHTSYVHTVIVLDDL